MRAVLTYAVLAATLSWSATAQAESAPIAPRIEVNGPVATRSLQNLPLTEPEHPLIQAAFEFSPGNSTPDQALSNTSDQLAGTATRLLAVLATLAMIKAIRGGRPQRLVKIGAEGRRYDPHVRGLFDD